MMRPLSRPSRGAWIEIHLLPPLLLLTESRPSRGAWIEMWELTLREREFCSSRPSRGAWIEILTECWGLGYVVSRPSRGAWIEMHQYSKPRKNQTVAPLAGRVD